jgi:hypothetical protein
MRVTPARLFNFVASKPWRSAVLFLSREDVPVSAMTFPGVTAESPPSARAAAAFLQLFWAQLADRGSLSDGGQHVVNLFCQARRVDLSALARLLCF